MTWREIDAAGGATKLTRIARKRRRGDCTAVTAFEGGAATTGRDKTARLLLALRHQIDVLEGSRVPC